MDPELMRAIQDIRESQIRAEERGVADRAFQARMLEVLEGLRDSFQRVAAALDARNAPGLGSREMLSIIRWLALAVVLASLGSKALELVAPAIGLGTR